MTERYDLFAFYYNTSAWSTYGPFSPAAEFVGSFSSYSYAYDYGIWFARNISGHHAPLEFVDFLIHKVECYDKDSSDNP